MEPATPIQTNLLICEKVLTEVDAVNTAVRIADVFRVKPDPDIPAEKRPISIAALFTARFSPDDDSTHALEVKLERPNGDIVIIGGMEPTRLQETFSGTPRGLNVPPRFGVVPL